MGSVIKFPRNGTRRGDAEWHHRDNAALATRTKREASIITWIDVQQSRDGDDDNNGGGSAA